MRLICPNCDAQYEVDAGAIPDGGRDVQCSNCGHAWFQASPDLEAEMAAENALFGSVTAQAASAAPAPEPETEPEPEPGDLAPVLEATRRPEPLPDAGPVPEVAAADVSANPSTDLTAAPRRGLDDSVLAVLREEAEREAAARRTEAPRPLETQTDLGLMETTGGAAVSRGAKDRLARLRGADAGPEITERPAARRDLLPDIEEINSTLRSSSENRPGEAVAVAQQAAPPSGSGFRSGFALVMLLAVLLTAAYVSAPRISQHLPASAGAMRSYVAAVDGMRAALDAGMRKATSGLQGLTGGNGN